MAEDIETPQNDRFENIFSLLTNCFEKDNEIITEKIPESERKVFLHWCGAKLARPTHKHVSFTGEEFISLLKSTKWTNKEALRRLTECISPGDGTSYIEPILLGENGGFFWYLQPESSTLEYKAEGDDKFLAHDDVTELRHRNTVFGYCYDIGKLIRSGDTELKGHQNEPIPYSVVVDLADPKHSLWAVLKPCLDDYTMEETIDPLSLRDKECYGVRLMDLQQFGKSKPELFDDDGNQPILAGLMEAWLVDVTIGDKILDEIAETQKHVSMFTKALQRTEALYRTETFHHCKAEDPPVHASPSSSSARNSLKTSSSNGNVTIASSRSSPEQSKADIPFGIWNVDADYLLNGNGEPDFRADHIDHKPFTKLTEADRDYHKPVTDLTDTDRGYDKPVADLTDREPQPESATFRFGPSKSKAIKKHWRRETKMNRKFTYKV